MTATRKISSDLKKFLKPFPRGVQETTLALRDFVLRIYPKCYELIYDNYNTLAIGFAISDKASDAFCSLAVYSKHVNFGLNRGSEVKDIEERFTGSGVLYRHLTVRSMEDFPKSYVRKLVKEAYRNALRRRGLHTQNGKGVTITKSISPVKRRP